MATASQFIFPCQRDMSIPKGFSDMIDPLLKNKFKVCGNDAILMPKWEMRMRRGGLLTGYGCGIGSVFFFGLFTKNKTRKKVIRPNEAAVRNVTL